MAVAESRWECRLLRTTVPSCAYTFTPTNLLQLPPDEPDLSVVGAVCPHRGEEMIHGAVLLLFLIILIFKQSVLFCDVSNLGTAIQICVIYNKCIYIGELHA